MNKKPPPERTCVGCGIRRPRAEMIRVCRTGSGEILVDTGGGTPGRGCYVCPGESCVTEARRKKSISRSLKHEVPSAIYDELERAASEADTPGDLERPR